MVLVNKSPFSIDMTITESIFYLPYVKPIMLTNNYKEGSMESCNLTSQGFK